MSARPSAPSDQRRGPVHTIEEIRIAVSDGTVSAAFTRPAHPVATLVVAPGAGAAYDHPVLVGFGAGLADAGVATLRFNFPYREAGRRLPGAVPPAIAAWRAAMVTAAGLTPAVPVWAGGKSYGGRMASMAVAEGMPAAGLVYLGYPLHPPGKPEKPRDAHLYGLDLPQLFLHGTRDPFAAPEELAPVIARIGPLATLRLVDGANHSFEVRGLKRTAAETGAALAALTAEYLLAGPA
jgi:predicted alpha/beta-hydrolase family hydrolase